MPTGTSVERDRAATRHHDVAPGGKTPNCVECSRCTQHAVCLILHLGESGWVTEATSRYDERELVNRLEAAHNSWR